jgi:hypothetical protein
MWMNKKSALVICGDTLHGKIAFKNAQPTWIKTS